MPTIDELYGQSQAVDVPYDTGMEGGSPDPAQLRAQLAGVASPEDLEKRALELRVGDVEFGRRPMFAEAGAFGPRDVWNIGNALVGGVAAGVGAGARGIAHFATRKGAVEALKDPAEMLFQEAAQRTPNIGDMLARRALGAAAAGSAGAASAQTRAPGGSTEAPKDWNRGQISRDMVKMRPEEFVKVYGVLPENALSMVEARDAKNPPGFFRSLFGGGGK